jgi:hypothetical protein
VRRAGVVLSRDVRVALGDLEMSTRWVRVPLRWEDARRPDLFPVVEASLEIVPVSPGRPATTQVGFIGRYEPPLGRLGALADTLAGNRVVFESIELFLEDLVDRLERDLPPERDHAEAADPRPPATSSNRLRRVYLPLDGLSRRPGGAAEIRRRLEGNPGVAQVRIDPVTEMAVVEYDATTCSLRQILSDLDGEDT